VLISHSRRFIFIHVGKTGGMSMRDVLKPYADEPDRFKMRRPARLVEGRANPLYTVWETLLLHAKVRDVATAFPAEFETYFKFAFVRNPWDLLVSLYHFILREPTAAKHDQVKAAGSFERFVEWAIATSDPFPKGITKLQSNMLVDAQGALRVDFLGHYETIEEDFAAVCRRLGIEASLPHLNRSRHDGYLRYYDNRTRDLVADHFRRDIDLFGYAFEGLRKGVGA
jgi:hypothetical protein